MIETTTIALVYISYLAFAAKRLMTYMHVLQQDDYDNKRLFKWTRENNVFDKKLSLALVILGGAWFLTASFLSPEIFISFFVVLCFSVMSYSEKDPRKDSKKKLVATTRAKRIFFPSYVILMIIGLHCFKFTPHPWFWIPIVQSIPFILMLTNILIKPFEDIVQQGYWKEAHSKISELRPTTIAITGSYGKTSVKHILGHILKSQAPTLITPGSVNTPMGITRVIREELDDTHKYFVVEMGAYGPGSIKRLCRLTPPDIGIITSVGHAHYERFKSLDTVAKTKFELAASVLNKNKEGKIIIHERTLRFPYPRQQKTEHPENFTVCGDAPEVDTSKQTDVFYIADDDLQIVKLDQTGKGLDIKLKWKDKVYNLEVPLFGAHHGHNAALAFAAALELGIAVDDIYTALRSLPQIKHRLEVKKQPDGTTLIDDAYNSNPVGFKTALDLLSIMNKKEGRTILITPGMVEMGSAHDQAHLALGQQAGHVCDVAVIVSPERIRSFIGGFKATGGNKTLIEVASFSEAAQWLEKNKQDNDVILIENDLPDMYERIPKL